MPPYGIAPIIPFPRGKLSSHIVAGDRKAISSPFESLPVHLQDDNAIRSNTNGTILFMRLCFVAECLYFVAMLIPISYDTGPNAGYFIYFCRKGSHLFSPHMTLNLNNMQ